MKSLCGFSERPELLNPRAHVCAFIDLFLGRLPGFPLFEGVLNSQKGKNPCPE